MKYIPEGGIGAVVMDTTAVEPPVMVNEGDASFENRGKFSSAGTGKVKMV